MPPVDLPAVTTASTSWLVAEWKYLVALLLIVACALWLWRRTGSTHVFTAILLRRVLGQRLDGSPALATFLSERDDLMRFRALTGLKTAPTLAAAERVAAWSREHDLDIDKVSAAQAYLDFSQPALKPKSPGFGVIAFAELLAIVLFSAAAFGVYLGVTVPVMVRVIQTDTWYLVENHRARRATDYLSPRAGFTKEECGDKDAVESRTKYVRHDVVVMCGLLAHEEGPAALDDSRDGQRILFGMTVALLLVFGSVVRRFHVGADAAYLIREQLERCAKQPPSS